MNSAFAVRPSGYDFLLLNASNYPGRPIYPYAFVQVSALARRRGLRVGRLDLIRFPQDEWDGIVRKVVGRTAPQAVGLHIRQTDSLVARDYTDGPGYHPLRLTKDVVRIVRDATTAPIVVGGFGFSLRPEATLRALGADVGVAGEPDELFERWGDLVGGTLAADAVANVLVRSSTGAVSSGTRRNFGPSTEAEYSSDVIEDLKRFYGSEWLGSDRAPTVPIELARGCPYSCFFCTEPQVKGKKFRVRNLDAVFDDVERLLRADLRRFWLVCSEANILGNELALAVAERMSKLREKYGPVQWTCYLLPRISLAELRVLVASGWYLGGFNDVVSLAPSLMRKAKVPYRAEDASSFLGSMAVLADETPSLTDDSPIDRRRQLGLFLAHPEETAGSLAQTLERLDAIKLLPGGGGPALMRGGNVTHALRRWDETLSEHDIPAPMFQTPLAFTEAFPTRQSLDAFVLHLEGVVLAPRYRESRDEAGFFRRRRGRLVSFLKRHGEIELARVLGVAPPDELKRAYPGVMAALHRTIAPLLLDLGVRVRKDGVALASDFGLLRAAIQSTGSGRGVVRALSRFLSPTDARFVATLLAFEHGYPLCSGVASFLYGSSAS